MAKNVFEWTHSSMHVQKVKKHKSIITQFFKNLQQIKAICVDHVQAEEFVFAAVQSGTTVVN